MVSGGFIRGFFADVGLAVFLSMLNSLIQRHGITPFLFSGRLFTAHKIKNIGFLHVVVAFFAHAEVFSVPIRAGKHGIAFE
jgi:hypothetical protein